MSNITFESIQHLVASQEVQGSSVSVTFQCAATQTEVTSSASLRRQNSMKSNAVRTIKKNMWSGLRRSVTRAVADALGSGTAGRVAKDLAAAGLKQGQQKMAFDKDEVQAGVVEAFQAVQASFRWNDESSSWVGLVKPANAFEKQLAEHPVRERYDQGVLARTLIELSAADGEISSDEVEFMQDFLNPELGSVDELAKREALTQAELAETSEGARRTIVMLGWACAMSDEELAEAEVLRLQEIASGLGLDQAASNGLRGDAQQFLFEQILGGVYEGGSRDEDAYSDAREAAHNMGIDVERAAQIDASYRKAAGIV